MDTNGIKIQNDGLQTLKALVTAVEAFSNDTSFRYASEVVYENARLRKQIDSQEADLTTFKEREKELEAKKETTYREILDMNEKAKQKNVDASKEIKMLNAKIQENEQMIANLKKEAASMENTVKEAQRLYDEEKKKVTQVGEDITKLQKEFKDNQKLVDQLRSAGSKGKRAYEILETRFKDLETEKSRIEEKFKLNSSRLGELESYGVEFNDDPESVLSDKLFDLWEFCSNAMAVHLRRNIPMDRLKDSQALKKLKNPTSMSHQVPLPPSNTSEAKEMRLAVFMGLIARELAERIFQPCYISLSGFDIQDILFDVAMEDSKRESYYRAILLAMSPLKQKTVLEEQKRTFVKNVGSYFSDLLPAEQYTELRQALEVVVERACETWKSFQYNRNMYEPDFDLLEWGDEWDPFFQPNSNPGQEQRPINVTDDAVLAIFPRICRVGNGEYQTVNYGTALTKYQCSGAEQELKKKEPSSPRAARAGLDRQRHRGMSISLGGSPDQNGSFLGDTEPKNK